MNDNIRTRATADKSRNHNITRGGQPKPVSLT